MKSKNSSSKDYKKIKFLNHPLLEILANDRNASQTEKNDLEQIKKDLDDHIYVEAVYLLTHTLIWDADKAKKLFNQMINHKNKMSKDLKRPVGIEVAAFDYLKNKKQNIFKKEQGQIYKIIKSNPENIMDMSVFRHDKENLKYNLDIEIERAQRYNRPLSVLFCSIDDLNKIGEKYGRQMVDFLLEKIEESIKKTVRNTDLNYRFGIDEFILILPETDILTAETVSKRIQTAVSKITHHETKFHFSKPTITIGGAELDSTELVDSETLISAADYMMYLAKNKGKGQRKFYDTISNQSIIKDKESKVKTERTIFKGDVISKGSAFGKAFVYKDILSRDVLSYTISENQIEKEANRIRNVIDQVLVDLDKMKKNVKMDLGQSHADIFEFHKQILKDKKLIREFEFELKKELVNAEQAVKNVFRKWAARFQISTDEKLKTKVNDIHDLSRRMLRILLGYEENELEKLPPDSIIVTKRLLPSDTVHIKRLNLKGIISEQGSKLCHSALLARGLGIPAITGIKNITKQIKKSDSIAINGHQNQVIIHPNEKDIQIIEEYNLKTQIKDKDLIINQPSINFFNKNNEPILIMANASSQEDISLALLNHCDGIGLFRLEQYYLLQNHLPDEVELCNYLSQIFTPLTHHEIIIRLLDVGGDKNLPYLNMKSELSPMLGLRGVRLLLKHKNLLKTQLRVLLRLRSKYNIKILIPMVTVVEEIKEIKKIILECSKELSKETGHSVKRIPLGAMIETPASVLNIESITEESDFLSIGTNDLIQYTMCAGRENSNVLQYYEYGSNTVMPFIEKVIEQSSIKNIPCSLCGELAGDLEWTEQLLDIGLTHYSVFPHFIPYLRSHMQKTVSI